jgi:hypothetical protein
LAWKKYFPEPEYEHKFWNDDEVATFIDDECSRFSEAYDKEQRVIVRSDFSRYCILWRIGGIYADLDYMPLENFYADLKPGVVNLIESPYRAETVQNSLMASPPHHPYWAEIMDTARYTMRASNVLLAAGPRLLDVSPQTHNLSAVHILPCNEFQRVTKSVEEKVASEKGCKLLRPEALHDGSLKGIHWGTVSYDRKGKNSKAETPDVWTMLFQRTREDNKPEVLDIPVKSAVTDFVKALLT